MAGSAAVTPRGRDSPGQQDSGTSGDVLVFECNRYSLNPSETTGSKEAQARHIKPAGLFYVEH